MTYRLRSGLRVELRAGSPDHGVFYEVFILRVYNPPGFAIGEGDTVVDIGAHVGCFSVLAGARARQGRVLSFEPTLQNFELLRRNLEANRLGHVVPVQVAVADKAGGREMFLSETNPGGHSFYRAADHVASTRVPTLSLEDVMQRYNLEAIDFLKVDCEGGEYDVLAGCPDRVLECIRKISMETQDYGEGRNVDVMRQLLEQKGFVVSTRPEWSMLYATR